jgi:hypothetical protein
LQICGFPGKIGAKMPLSQFQYPPFFRIIIIHPVAGLFNEPEALTLVQRPAQGLPIYQYQCPPALYKHQVNNAGFAVL